VTLEANMVEVVMQLLECRNTRLNIRAPKIVTLKIQMIGNS
jgi:hypothetical protein